ncbi:hypothetical protein ACVGXX_00075, partial [Enterobacter intestinihominis]
MDKKTQNTYHTLAGLIAPLTPCPPTLTPEPHIVDIIKRHHDQTLIKIKHTTKLYFPNCISSYGFKKAGGGGG